MFKYLAFVLIIILLIIVGIFYILPAKSKVKSHPKYGVSFSPNLISYLKMDPEKVYFSILDDLEIKSIRIPSFWDQIQPRPDLFDFKQTDFLIDEASRRNIRILFVVGMKQPRWPECHIPEWVKTLSLEQRQQQTINYIQETVKHYQSNSQIWGWQVENEPLFSFGNCGKADEDFLKKEIEAVKTLDPQRPIIVTDTGEWSLWSESMKLSDILGISIYRKAYNPLFGYIKFPMPSFWYDFKSQAVRNIYAHNNKKTIVTELQAEPWLRDTFIDTPISEQLQLFTLDDFKDNVVFANNLGFDETYLWGVEWWYFMKEKGHQEYWNYAKTLFYSP